MQTSSCRLVLLKEPLEILYKPKNSTTKSTFTLLTPVSDYREQQRSIL